MLSNWLYNDGQSPRHFADPACRVAPATLLSGKGIRSRKRGLRTMSMNSISTRGLQRTGTTGTRS